MPFLPFLSFLVVVLLLLRLLIPLFLGVLFLVPNVAPFFIFLLPNAIFISIYRCLVAIRPPPLLSLSDPSDRFFGRLYGRRPFRRSASLFGHFGYSGRLSHVDRRDCFAALAIPAPSFLAATILAAIRPTGRCFSWPLQPLISIIGWRPPRSTSLFVHLAPLI